MNDSIELRVKKGVDLEELRSWLSTLSDLMMEMDGPLAVDVVPADEGMPSEDKVALLLKIGPCPGRNAPFFTFDLPKPDPPDPPDPPPNLKQLVLDAGEQA